MFGIKMLIIISLTVVYNKGIGILILYGQWI